MEAKWSKSHKRRRTAGLDWSRGPLLGRGSFATVNLAVLRGDVVAVKSATLSNSSTLQWEKRVLSTLAGCPQVLECYSSCTAAEPSGETLFNLFLMYVPGGSLSDRVAARGALPESDVRRYVKSILQGLKHVHDHGYVHCDVKLKNLLVDEDCGGVIKIADFGLARKKDEGCDGGRSGEAIWGTPMYMAPESVSRGEFWTASDIWSVGCATVEMVTGKPPWRGADVAGLLLRIASRDEIPSLPEELLSAEGRDFLGKCFLKDPTKRPSAEELLAHPFVTTGVESEQPSRASPKTIFDFPEWADLEVSPSSTLTSPISVSASRSPAGSISDAGAERRVGELAAGKEQPTELGDSIGWITVREAKPDRYFYALEHKQQFSKF